MTPARFFRLFSQPLLVLALFLSCQAAAQQQSAPAPATPAPSAAPSATAVEGTWSATPLLIKGAAVPGGSGQFLEFGEAYTTESFLAFWARTGPDMQKDWVLFSWKNGQLTRVLQRGVGFVGPDSRKVKVGEGSPTILLGKRLLYISPTYPAHVYAWDGEKLVKVLSAGDELQFGNERYTIKRANALDTAPAGKVLIAFAAPSQHATGWVIHDGASFTPLLAMRSLSIKCSVQTWEFTCLDEWDAMGYWTVRLLTDFLPSVSQLPTISQLARDKGKNVCPSLRSWGATGGVHGRFTRWNRGWLELEPSLFPSSLLPGQQNYRNWVSLAPDAPRSLAAEVEVEWKGKAFLRGTFRSHPHLYFWNGEKLSSVAWEESIGLSPAAVTDLSEKPGFSERLADDAGNIAHIRIRAIPGPIGGVSVQLPDLGDKPRTWYVPANSTDGHLQQPPRFAVAGHVITLADVVSWKEADVVALTEEGLFQLRRTH